MKCLASLSLAVLLVVAGPSLTSAGPAEEAAEMAVQWVQAFNAGNADALSALYAKDAGYIAPLAPFRIDGRDAIQAYFAGVFRAFPVRAIVLRQGDVQVYDDVTVAHHYWSLTMVDAKGNGHTWNGRSNSVSKPVQGRRMILTHHGSLLPPSP